MSRVIAWCVLAFACTSPDARVAQKTTPPRLEARLPRAPGEFAPSLVAIQRAQKPSDVSDGTLLSDVDSCATCHPDAAAQWSASAHSFASFGNPIYRESVERVRADLGKPASRHCGGCHDLPLLIDGLMTSPAAIPANDLRAHSGVTCRLCHGVQRTTTDGNGSYVWDATPIDAPVLDNADAIARHKRQVATKLDTELCVGCHRGFLSPDMTLPVHLSGIDEPGAWRSSAFTGNGMARIDRAPRKTCIDCHMERVAAGTAELGAKHGTIASHRFVGGHTWMAAMRGDAEQLHLTQAKLEGAASIDIAGARTIDRDGATWHLPAETVPVVPGTRLELDVVIRNLLVGHRFPGGVLDIQDTWVEVEVADRHGKLLASSGLSHRTDPDDEDSHVLRTLVVDRDGQVLEQHEIAQFRSQVATQTLAPREAQAVRYGFAVPAHLDRDQLPLAVTARLQHRSRSLALQAAACATARSPEGKAFIAGARAARDVDLDPCKPQPITQVAETRLVLSPTARAPRPDWERIYEHGMALVASIVTRVDEARAVLEVAHARAPDARSRAMVAVQLGWVASKQGRVDDALAFVREARELLAVTPTPNPPVLDAIAADAFVRANRWADAITPAKACTEGAPGNTAAWSVYARVLGAVEDHATALAAAAHGLALSPRDPDLLRTQATALAALHDPRAEAAQAAYTRFRSPDEAAALRIRCATRSERCARDRNPVHTLPLRPAADATAPKVAEHRQRR
jgi:hypothetical protein